MSVSLSKGGNVSLEKEAGDAGLKGVIVGLGWDARKTDGKDFDLDASCFLTTGDGKVRSDKDFIFYKQLSGCEGNVVHQGDNKTGEGEGDDEQIMINLINLPPEIEKIPVVVTIHEAEERGQNFGQVENAFIRVINVEDNKELARYDLSEDFSMETAVVFGEIYKKNNEWKLKAIGSGSNGGLKALALNYGVDVG